MDHISYDNLSGVNLEFGKGMDGLKDLKKGGKHMKALNGGIGLKGLSRKGGIGLGGYDSFGGDSYGLNELNFGSHHNDGHGGYDDHDDGYGGFNDHKFGHGGFNDHKFGHGGYNDNDDGYGDDFE